MRAPWTIWRHISGEMWRLLLLTAAVLVAVTAFAVTVRYTAEGKLGPLETLRFMGLAAVPMLQYVLPFAAGFGATLAYHRMTQENELTAAKASGVSHRALLAPALLTGVVLAGALWGLNGQVIPRFLRSMERMIALDAAKLVARSVEAGQPIVLGRRIVYADRVYNVTPEDGGRGGASEVLLLTGVAAMELGSRREVVSDLLAPRAVAAFFPAGRAAAEEGGGNAGGGDSGGGADRDPDVTMLVLDLHDARGRGPMGHIQASPTVVYPLVGAFSDDPKYCTNAELAAIPDDPDRMNMIDTRRRGLALRIAERDAVAAMDGALRSRGEVRMTDRAGRAIVIRAAGVEWRGSRWELLPPASPPAVEGGGGAGNGTKVEVEIYPAGASTDPVRLACESAGLTPEEGAGPALRRLEFALEVEQFSAKGPGEGDPAGARLKKVYGGLTPESSPLDALLEMPSAALLAEVDRRAALRPEQAIEQPARDLRQRIAKLRREVLSKRHERAAMSAACLVMVLTGAVTAMRLAERLPLTVYLWSFFPALAALITISAGQNMTHRMGGIGLAVLWGGVAALAAYSLGAFLLVRKH